MIKTRLKKEFLILLIGLVYGYNVKGQNDTLPVQLTGSVESVDTAFSLPYIHVINLRTGLGVISDTSGNFRIKILPNDTVKFRCIGFSEFTFNLPDSVACDTFKVVLKMAPLSYQLKDVNIYALTRQQQFKYDFTNIKVDKNLGDDVFYIPGVTNPNYRHIRNREKPVYPTYIGGYMGFIYRMTDKSKSLEKLADLRAEDKLIEANNLKYNMKILSELTGFSGDKLLAYFIYLGFSVNYVNKSNEYEIYLRIKNNIEGFEKHYKANGLPLNFLKSGEEKTN